MAEPTLTQPSAAGVASKGAAKAATGGATSKTAAAVKGVSGYAAQAQKLAVDDEQPAGFRRREPEAPGVQDGASPMDAGARMDRLEKRVDDRMQATDAKVALYKTTSDLQGFALADTQKKQAEQTQTMTSLAISGINLHLIETKRLEAIGRVLREVKTAPPPLSTVFKDIIQTIASAVIGGITGGLTKVFLGDAPKLLGTSLAAAGSAASSTGVAAGLTCLMADPESPEVFFLGLENAARAEMGVFLQVIAKFVAQIPNAAEPAKLAKGIEDWVAKAANDAYDTQYTKTIDAYYDALATATLAKPVNVLTTSMEEYPEASKGSFGDLNSSADGLITLKGSHVTWKGNSGMLRVANLSAGEFEGAKTEEHRESVGARALEAINIPMRIELDASVGEGDDAPEFNVTVARRGGTFSLEGEESMRWWWALRELGDDVPLFPTSEAVRSRIFLDTLAKRMPGTLTGWKTQSAPAMELLGMPPLGRSPSRTSE